MSIELARSYRGTYQNQDAVEVTHFGSIAVVDGNGVLVLALGDVVGYAHLRSTAKPFQLLPFLNRNLHKKSGLDSADVALLMSSHSGEAEHVTRLATIMQKLDVKESELLCGVPKHKSVLQNNCSGKHCAMIATCKAEGWDAASYLDEEHPLQREIAAILLECAGAKTEQLGIGVDGCSAPTFIMPLTAIARLYGCLAQPKSVELKLLFEAGAQNPYMMAGTKRLDTVLMQLGEGSLFAKTGADGVYAMAIAPNEKYPNGLGVAIKINDGDVHNRARQAVALSLLMQLDVLSETQIRSNPDAAVMLDGKITNYRGIVTGKAEAVFALR
jgi:L-asparaginase II